LNQNQENVEQNSKKYTYDNHYEDIDCDKSQKILNSFTENCDNTSLNQSGMKVMLNNPLGLNKSYMEDNSFNKSDFESFRSKLEYSQINQIPESDLVNQIYGKAQYSFAFQRELEHQHFDFRLNDFDEHLLSQLTDDTQDLSHLSIPRFKNNFYQKDNSLYLNMTKLDQSNISNIKDKSVLLNKTMEKDFKKSVPNVYKNKQQITSTHVQENMENILAELDHVTNQQKFLNNSLFEENKTLDEKRGERENEVFSKESKNVSNPYEFRQTAHFVDTSQGTLENVLLLKKKYIPGLTTELVNSPEAKVEKNDIGASANEDKLGHVFQDKMNQNSLNKKKYLIEEESDEGEQDKGVKENLPQIMEKRLSKLSLLDISKISIFETHQDNEEFIGNITANNVNVLLASEIKGGLIEQEKKNFKLESDFTLEFNQELNDEQKKDLNANNPNLDIDQHEISEVSLGKEETQITEYSREKKHFRHLTKDNKHKILPSKSFILDGTPIIRKHFLDGNKSFGEIPTADQAPSSFAKRNKVINQLPKKVESKNGLILAIGEIEEKGKNVKVRDLNKSSGALLSSEEKLIVQNLNKTCHHLDTEDQVKSVTLKKQPSRGKERNDSKGNPDFQLGEFDCNKLPNNDSQKLYGEFNFVMSIKKLSKDFIIELKEFLAQYRQLSFNDIHIKKIKNKEKNFFDIAFERLNNNNSLDFQSSSIVPKHYLKRSHSFPQGKKITSFLKDEKNKSDSSKMDKELKIKQFPNFNKKFLTDPLIKKKKEPMKVVILQMETKCQEEEKRTSTNNLTIKNETSGGFVEKNRNKMSEQKEQFLNKEFENISNKVRNNTSMGSFCHNQPQTGEKDNCIALPSLKLESRPDKPENEDTNQYQQNHKEIAKLDSVVNESSPLTLLKKLSHKKKMSEGRLEKLEFKERIDEDELENRKIAKDLEEEVQILSKDVIEVFLSPEGQVEKKTSKQLQENLFPKNQLKVKLPLIFQKEGRSSPQILAPKGLPKITKDCDLDFFVMELSKNNADFERIIIKHYQGSKIHTKKKFFGYKVKNEKFRRALNERKLEDLNNYCENEKHNLEDLIINNMITSNREENLFEKDWNKFLEEIDKNLETLHLFIQHELKLLKCVKLSQEKREEYAELIDKVIGEFDEKSISAFFIHSKTDTWNYILDSSENDLLFFLLMERMKLLIIQKLYFRRNISDDPQLSKLFDKISQNNLIFLRPENGSFVFKGKSINDINSKNLQDLNSKFKLSTQSYELLSDIESETEYSDKEEFNQSSSVKSLRPFVVEKKRVIKSTSERSHKDDQKKKFYSTAINIKLNLPPGHQGKKLHITNLFQECLDNNKTEEEWNKYLQNKFAS